MKLLRGKTPYIIAISFAIILAVLFFSIRQSTIIEPVRNLVFDSYQIIKPRQVNDSAVLVVDIDEDSIDAIGQWPWPRDQMAELTQKLTGAGAMSIGFDLVFAEVDRTSPAEIIRRLPAEIENREMVTGVLSSLPDTDDAFAEALAASPAVLGFFELDVPNDEEIEKKAGIAWLGDDLSDVLYPITGTVGSLPKFQSAAMGQGSVSVGESQQDDIIRSISLFSRLGDDVFPALAIEALRIAIQNASGAQQSFAIKTSQSGTEGASGYAITDARVANFEFPLTANGGFNIYYARNANTQYLPAYQVLDQENDQLSEVVGGKIVLIGTSAPGLRDIRTTTLRESVPGVAVHAQIIDQIMEGIFLNRPDWAPGAEALLAIVLTIAIMLVLPVLGAVSSAIFGGICAAIIAATSWFAFDWYGILFDPAVPLITALAAYGMTTLLLFAFAERERRFVRNAFQHYMAPELLAKLEEDPKALQLGGEIRELTLLFLDIRGFTPISEKLTPQELVNFLNDLLSPLSDIIKKHEGAIDKYIGDSIMAFWNAPLDVEDHPAKACRAALEMLAKVEEMNARDAFGFKERGLGDVGIGIGINTGDGCVGNMGSATRFDYSVVGDTVNVAARLESASKEARWPILISLETAKAVPGFALLGAGKLSLKGKSQPQEVFALVGDETIAETQDFRDLSEAFKHLRAEAKKPVNKRMKNLKQRCLELAPRHLHAFITR